ncbi:MAG: hypothetical protein ACREVR_14870 [Burkholderiales bacterium]
MSQPRWKQMMFGLALLAGFVVVTFGTGLGLFFWSQSEPPAQITRRLATAKPWFFLWRLLLFGSLIAFWPAFCWCVARWRKLANNHLARLLAARWQVAAWLLALELVLAQNVVGKFINLLVD